MSLEEFQDQQRKMKGMNPKSHQQKNASRNKDMPNLGWLFYRDYFHDYLADRSWENPHQRHLELPNPENILAYSHAAKTNSKHNKRDKDREENSYFSRKNRRILSRRMRKEEKESLLRGSHSFSLQSTYPGLLLGSGYTHETGGEGEFKLGFFFDHTTGMPIIPGSSLKGVLRSAFEAEGGEYMAYLIEEEVEEAYRMKLDAAKIKQLTLKIFEGNSGSKDKSPYSPMHTRDLFLDAFPVATGDGGLMATDFLAPHSSPFKDPIPLHFLKVAPEVQFEFSFILRRNMEMGVEKTVTPAHRIAWFKHILLEHGVGAKTNVGYGQFVAV